MRIALIGAGPRGLMVLERLIAWQKQAPAAPLEITLYDAYPIGGRVWRRDQDSHLIMNTAAQHITLFYDRTVADPGPIMPGPNLAQWAASDAEPFLRHTAGEAAAAYSQEARRLGPNDYPSRALYGYYQAWFFAEMQRRKQPNVKVTFTQTLVHAVTKAPLTVHTATTSEKYGAVVMALGTIENTLTREQTQLAAFAKAHQRFYLAPGFPAEGDLSAITNTDTVVLRGLGLSFFDFVSRLTAGRGGRFTTIDGALTYVPSGQEPTIIAGSRRGLPYHAKARNEKAPGEEWPARFLTDQQLANWAAKGHISGRQFFEGLQNEAGFVYYSLLLAQKHPEVDLAAFQADYLTAPAAALAKLNLPAAELLDWQALTTPPHTTDRASILAYLAEDAAAAALGSKTGPLTSALEVLRDIRDAIRQVVALNLLSDDEYLDFFLRWFNGTNDFLSIGPPAVRIAQLHALVASGLVSIAPPQIRIATAGDHFVVRSGSDPAYAAPATALIEARVPAPNAPTALNPLMQQLLHDGLATLYELQLAGDRRFQSGAVLVDRDTAQLLDSNHQAQGPLFFWGVPTEGVNWLTTASPRPFVNDVNLRLANRIARQIMA